VGEGALYRDGGGERIRLGGAVQTSNWPITALFCVRRRSRTTVRAALGFPGLLAPEIAINDHSNKQTSKARVEFAMFTKFSVDSHIVINASVRKFGRLTLKFQCNGNGERQRHAAIWKRTGPSAL